MLLLIFVFILLVNQSFISSIYIFSLYLLSIPWINLLSVFSLSLLSISSIYLSILSLYSFFSILLSIYSFYLSSLLSLFSSLCMFSPSTPSLSLLSISSADNAPCLGDSQHRNNSLQLHHPTMHSWGFVLLVVFFLSCFVFVFFVLFCFFHQDAAWIMGITLVKQSKLWELLPLFLLWNCDVSREDNSCSNCTLESYVPWFLFKLWHNIGMPMITVLK